MDYRINPINLLIAFGMLQGFFFAGILIWRSKFNHANKYLGLTVFFLSLYLLHILKFDLGFQQLYPRLQYLPILFLWGLGPAFYAYLRLLFGQPFSGKSLRWHFLPLLIEVFYFNSRTLILWLNDWDTSVFNPFVTFWMHSLVSIQHTIGLISIGIYLVKSYRLLRKFNLITARGKLKYILLSFVILWLIWMPYTILDIVYYRFAFPPSEFYAFYILFTGLTYCLGFFGFKLNPATDDNIQPGRTVEITEEMKTLANNISQNMSLEKHYLDPDLNIRDFARDLDLRPNKISAIVNSVLGLSFRDFVNAYRIDEFKTRLESYDLKRRTLLGLAYETGFNSKSSFNRIFRKSEGISPIEYVEKFQKSKTQNA